LPKKKSEQPKREVTKRQLSHWQRESRMQRIIMIGGLALILAVLAMVGTGVYVNKYKPYNAMAIKVADANREFSVDYYIDMLAYAGKTSYQSVSQFVGLAQYLGYLTGSESQPDTIASQIINNQFKVREADKQYGVRVSDDEVKQEIKNENLSTNQATLDAVRAALLETKLTDHFDKNVVPASVDQKNVEAMFLESQSQVEDIIKRLNNNEKFSDVAAQVSLEKVSKEKAGEFGWLPPGVLPTTLGNPNNTVLDDRLFSANTTANTLFAAEDKDQSKNIGYWLVEITDKPVATPTPTATTPAPTAPPAPKVHVLAMLLGSLDQAQDIKAKLEAGGEGNDFATLAKANSQFGNASTDGGDLGLLSKDDVKSKLGDVAAALVFPDDPSQALKTNTVSASLPDTAQSTKGGFWLFTVSASQSQLLTGDNRATFVRNKLTEWENQVWGANKDQGQIFLTQQQKTFAIAEAQKRMK